VPQDEVKHLSLPPTGVWARCHTAVPSGSPDLRTPSFSLRLLKRPLFVATDLYTTRHQPNYSHPFPLMDALTSTNLRHVTVGVVCLGLARYLYKNSRPKTTPLRGPSTWAPLGYAIELVRNQDLGKLYKSWIDEYGPVFQVPTVFGRKEVVISDPKALAHFFAKDTYSYRMTPAFAFAFKHFVCFESSFYYDLHAYRLLVWTEPFLG
jgi:hypothetical protein